MDVSNWNRQGSREMRLIAETRARPATLVVNGQEAGDVAVDLTVWLDHHGWQSGKGRLDGSRSQIFQALDAGHAEVSFECERFGIVIDDISPGRPAHFVLAGDLPEALVARWRPDGTAGPSAIGMSPTSRRSIRSVPHARPLL